MPDNRLESFRMRRYVKRVDCRNQHTDIRNLSSKTTIPADDSDNTCANVLRVFQSLDQVGTHVLLQIAATNGEYKKRVRSPQVAAGQPGFENRGPTFVIRAGGQLRHVVGRGVRFHAGDFPKIVYGVRRIRSASSNSENEQPALTLPGLRKQGNRLLNLDGIEILRDLSHFREIFPDERQTAVPGFCELRYA